MNKTPLLKDLYTKTNQNLFDVLKRSISLEKREIIELLQKEKNLKARINSEKKRIKKGKFKEKKNSLGRKIKRLKEKLNNHHRQLKRKKKLIQHIQKTILSLQKTSSDKKKKYGMRWPGTEGIFSAVKRIFSERVRSKKTENMCKEVYRRFWAYQILKYYGEKKVEM